MKSGGRPCGAEAPAARWSLPAALLVVELLGLSVLVELPSSGPARPLADAARLLLPVVVGASAAGWLLAGREPTVRLPGWPPGPGRWLVLLAQLAVFSGTAALGVRIMAPGAPSPGAAEFAEWVGGVAATSALAAALVAPPVALLRHAARPLGTPLLAVAAGVLCWRAIGAAERLWTPLEGATLGASAAILRVVSTDVSVLPAAGVIGARGFEVEIAAACSGVDGVGLVLVLLALWLALARSRVRVGRAVVLLGPVAAVAAFVANVARIVVLVLLGASGREELALGTFHSKLGWVLFVLLTLGIVAAAERVPWLRRDPGAMQRVDLPPEAPAHVAPVVAALAVAFATGLWAPPGFDPWYGARAVAAGLVLLAVRRSLPSPSLASPWVPITTGVAVSAAWIASAQLTGNALGDVLAHLAPGPRVAWIAARVVGSCLVIPVVEELAFRGLLLPWLASPRRPGAPAPRWPWTAIALSSLAFGALHERWVLGTAAGVAFAVVRLWRDRLGDAIVAHATCNAGLAAAVLIGGRWELWG